ncbi:MAG: glycosyltransferase family 2 protein [Ignavibacteriales bacterium]|nr:glycosyltransferase family 2 protein [Ignavibacteriales bacterium]
MKSQPLISIILCTFNRKHLVERAIHSVFEQTYSNWELLIIDDGSTDGSEKILLPLVKKDKRIIYTRHANKGLALSRNIGLQLSKGKYICFLDSDDEYEPNHIVKRLSFLEENSLDGIFGGMKIVGPKEKHFVPDAMNPKKKIHISKCHSAGTLFVKRKCLVALKGFRNISFAEDFDLIARLQKKYIVKRVSFPTYIYHVDSDNRLCDLFEEKGEKGILQFRNS